MKYFITALPMLFGVEIISWMCLVVLSVYVLFDFCKAAGRSRGDWND